MKRTPPRNVNTRRHRSGQNRSAHPQGSGQLFPNVEGEDYSNSPTPQPNTPSSSSVLQLILERLDNIEKQLEDHKRETDMKIRDLNALIIQSNSPRRSDKPRSPTPPTPP